MLVQDSSGAAVRQRANNNTCVLSDQRVPLHLAPSDKKGLYAMTERIFAIRPFAPGDQQAARSLILRGLGERFGCIDETLNPDLEDIDASYLDCGHIFLVAFCQQMLVGTAALLIQPEQTGQIVRVSTHALYRRQGIAYTLCLHLIDQARHHALRRLIVETTHTWNDAIGLYHRLGFVQYQCVHQEVFLQRALCPS